MTPWIITLFIITTGLIFIYAIHKFSNAHEKPIFEISEVSIDFISSEESAMAIVKMLAHLGYDVDCKNEAIGQSMDDSFKIFGHRRYINSRNDPSTAGLDDLIVLFNDCVDTIRKMGSVKIEITQGAGALDINLQQTKPIIKPGAKEALIRAGILKDK